MIQEFVYHSMVSILYLVATFWLIANNATFGYNLAGVRMMAHCTYTIMFNLNKRVIVVVR